MISFPMLLRPLLLSIPPEHHSAVVRFAEAFANWRQAGLERRVRELEGELAKPTKRARVVSRTVRREVELPDE